MNDCEELKQKISDIERKVDYLFDNLDYIANALEKLGYEEDDRNNVVLRRIDDIERQINDLKHAIDFDETTKKSKYLARMYAILKKLERKL